MATYVCKPADAERKWIVIDAEGQTLGRLSTFVARAIMGKHRPTYTPFTDTGDFVVVVNAEKVRLTGRKHEKKFYRWHTGYPGGLKEITAGRVLKEKPTRVIEWSVKGMLPKGRLGRRLGMKLKVYVGPQHPHQAQQPEKVSIPA
ncbi:MAG TPA: 50S ribosomal protein L13 [Candidatus Polarisedimenticolia bacterium]|nr:50S ribosomal protein L13 [Candidatus Polarisedimenticolia bacterium]